MWAKGRSRRWRGFWDAKNRLRSVTPESRIVDEPAQVALEMPVVDFNRTDRELQTGGYRFQPAICRPPNKIDQLRAASSQSNVSKTS